MKPSAAPAPDTTRPEPEPREPRPNFSLHGVTRVGWRVGTVNATVSGSGRVFPTVRAARLFGTGRLDPRSGAPSGAVPS